MNAEQQATQERIVLDILAEVVSALQDGRLINLNLSRRANISEQRGFSGPALYMHMGPDKVSITIELMGESG